ncbi:hypothetical protein [Metallosphaera sedula]|uniref:hypothetical protein n=1 Tax=Metallosphaera sedula TaxID=43687 RepID=UPI0020C02CFF|nr:hypothetical protein [Metallosphaera sedula]BBL45985.1 hypothetical protein MJ1HA_0072 [Metallosphaera sedula]
MSKKLQTVVSDTLYEKVIEYTRRYGVSQGEFVRQAIIEKLEEKIEENEEVMR